MIPPFRRIVIAALLALSASLALAQPLTLEEAEQRFEEADKALNAAWQKVDTWVPADPYARLLNEQRAWLANRDRRAAEYAAYVLGISSDAAVGTPLYVRARASLTQMRTQVLEGWIRHYELPFDTSWEGAWVDGAGGILLIDEHDPGRFEFHLEVVRWPHANIGVIGGLARRNHRTAWFEHLDPDRTRDTWFTFIREDLHLRIQSENSERLGGMGAYFDNDYIRVRDLTDEDRRRIATSN